MKSKKDKEFGQCIDEVRDSMITYDDSSQSYYLEEEGREKEEGGNENLVAEDKVFDIESLLMNAELYVVEQCGKEKIFIKDKFGNIKPRNIRCQKTYCPRCGGKDGYIHNRKMENISTNLGNTKIDFFRQLVFTVPQEFVERLKTKKMLNALVDLVKRIIEKEFGQLVRVKEKKKGPEKIYRLRKKVLASVELFGDGAIFHPHVNILIFEQNARNNHKTITPDKLCKIKQSYKNALEKMLQTKIKEAVVNYKYHAQTDYEKRQIK